MSSWDELKGKVAREAAEEVVESAIGRVRKAIESEASDVLSFAERELEERTAAREGRLERLEEAADKARSERLERKSRALEELKRRKAAMGLASSEE